MRKFLVVSLVFVTLTLALTMLIAPGAAQASSVSPNRLLAAATPTPTLSTANRIPPSGALQPTPTSVAQPDRIPPSGGDRPDNDATPFLFIAGVMVFALGLILRSRRRTTA